MIHFPKRRPARSWILLKLIATCLLGGQTEAARPNVIVLLTDDQGYRDLACTGNEIIRTPHLDRLHAESVRLTDFHVNSVCSPSRAALLSGRYASAVGVWHTLGGRDLMSADAVIMPQVFAANGYRTLMVGKWHLGDNYPFRPEDRGFEKVYRIGGGSPGQIADYWGNGIFDTHYWTGKNWEESKGFCTDTQFDRVLQFLADKGDDRPFFIYLSTTAVHSPIGAPDEYLQMYDGLSKELRSFYGMVSNLDWNVGRLRSALDDLGLSENTLLIYLSDNGSACDKKGTAGAYNAGMRGKKGSQYEGGHRVPCFIHWPAGGFPQAADVTQLTAHIDLLPTLAHACELGIPANEEWDGTSLLPLLRNPDAEFPSRTLVTEAKVNKRERPFDSGVVMRGSKRLVNRGTELYDIIHDPSQKTDVSSTSPELVRQMRSAYEKWYRSLAPSFAKIPSIIIGSPKANPARLTAMDVHTTKDIAGGKTVWNQKGVQQGAHNRGVWELTVAEAGDYRISLQRWPSESGLRFRDTPHKARAAEYREARIQIADHQLTQPIDSNSQSVDFHVRLKTGPTQLDAVLIESDDSITTAYFVTIEHLK